MHTEWAYGGEVAWREIANPPEIERLEAEELMLLHRHWLGCSHAQTWMAETAMAALEARARALEVQDGVEFGGKNWCALFTYYGFLWSVVEGFGDRKIVFRGALGDDVAALEVGLRRARNATFHVSEKAYWDKRFYSPLMDDGKAVPPRISRVFHGLGRLLREELQRRGMWQDS